MAKRPIAYHAAHDDKTVPLCVDCKMEHGSIRTPRGLVCAACWMKHEKPNRGPVSRDSVSR